MALEDYLQDDEEIIAKVFRGNTKFYATNKKVIRYQESILSEKIDMIFYPHIASISITSYLYNGIAWIIAGIMLLIFSFTYLDDFLRMLDITEKETITFFTVLFIIFTITVILQGIYNLGRASLNFIVAGFSTTDKMKWNIQRAKSNELRKFVKIIQKEIAKYLVEIEKIMEKTKK